MSDMPPDPPSGGPLPWEVKAAVVGLTLLSLQEIHEGVLYCLGVRAPGDRGLQSAFMILLVFYLTLGSGLLLRSRIAWLFTVLLLGLLAATQVLTYEEDFQQAFFGRYYLRELLPTMKFRSRRLFEGFALSWQLVRAVLLTGVPALLLLGALRRRLRGPA